MILLIVLLTVWILFSPDGLLGKADAIGYAVCHRIGNRSFHIGDRPISVCARCSGQYLGAVLSILFLSVFRRNRTGRPPWSIIGFLLACGVIYAIDGLNSFMHLIPGTERFWLYEPSNSFRMITGMGVGIGIGILIMPPFNQTMWRRFDRRPILDGWRDFMILLILAGLLIILVLTENPLILYPLSIVSAGGVLMLLTMVYSMVWVMIFRAEGRFDNLRQLTYPIMAGLVVALLQIFVIDYFRYLLTGTWGEFPLG